MAALAHTHANCFQRRAPKKKAAVSTRFAHLVCDVVRKNPGARGNEQQQDRRQPYITLCLLPDHRIHSTPFGSVTAGEKLLEL